jgi:class 3 adenylate cyclase/tetratricopeptide (TPR) repeat protein
MDVATWLEALGLGQYAPAFVENDIDLALLSTLSEADLRELGVVSLGHRKRLLAAIAERVAVAPSAFRAAVPPGGERRQVTILFADLSGFTALSQSLDPEELRDLVGRYTALVDGVIADCGGSVDKHIGDAVMALFGAPLAHDDDPLRAARAALDIHDGLMRLSVSLGRRLEAHIGIASGEVVAGTLRRGESQDYTVLGDSVNLAARLVAEAGPCQTLIADNVHRALSGRSVSDALGEMQLKGVTAPVRVWNLRGISGESSPSNRSPFVGREGELQQFRAIVAGCLSRGSGHLVYVRGEAGIGKTRFVEEMRVIAEAKGFQSHRGLMLDFGLGKGQDPIRAILRSLLGLGAGAAAEERASVAQRAVTEGSLAPEQLVFLYDLLDLAQSGERRALYDAMDNAARNRGKRAVAAALAEVACRRGPAIIIVEDLHWAGPLVLSQIAAIASAIASGAGLLVMTSRVEGDPLDAAWRASCRGTALATIDLGPLRDEEARSLAGGFIDATQGLARACIARSGGNPLFLEQLLRNAEEGSEAALPASLQSLVLARMDRLPPLDRQAFQAAAVIGQRFELPLLRHLLGIADYTSDALVANALVLPEGDDFLFAHALIQEGAYASLLRARRRELHTRAAAWFAEHDPTLRAQHLDRAEDATAPGAYLEAATTQRGAYHVDAALALAERGLALVRDAAERHALACLKGELQRDLGDVAGSISTFRDAVATAPDAISRCRAALGLADGLRVSDGLEEALALLQSAQQIAEQKELVSELARLHHLRGNVFFPLGKIDGCRTEHELGLAYARRSGSPEAEARALGGLGDAAYAQGRMRSAFGHFSRCVALCQEHGFGRIEVANRSMVGFSRLWLAEVREALEDGNAAARAAALVGQRRAELLGETMCGLASFELGAFDAAERQLGSALRLARQLGARRFEVQTLAYQGRLRLHQGERAEAMALLCEALELSDDVSLQFFGPVTFGGLSRAAEHATERAKWLAKGEAVLRQGSVGHCHLFFYRDAMEAMLLARDQAGTLRYADALEAYTRAEPLPLVTLFIERGRALAVALEGPPDAQLGQALGRIVSAMRDVGLTPFLPQVEAALAACSEMSPNRPKQ